MAPPASLVMSGRANPPQRRPLAELPRSGPNAPRAVTGGKLGGAAGGAGAKHAVRPATAQPGRRGAELLEPVLGLAVRGGAARAPVRAPASHTVEPASEGANERGHGGGTGAGGSMEERLSAELLRLLEERAQGQPSPPKVSPHKEVAVRASEECPRRPLAHRDAKGGAAKTGASGAATRVPASSRITPCAPSEPKVAAHARKTFKAASRPGSARPSTAAPRMEQQHAPQGDALGGSKPSGGVGVGAAPAKHRAPEPPAGSRESSRERSANGAVPAGARARRSRERAPEAKRTDAAAAAAGARVASGEQVAGRAKSTIADLIARFRNGPPQRPDQRKAAAESSSSIFWWRKDGGSEAGSTSGGQDSQDSVSSCPHADGIHRGSAEGSLVEQPPVAGAGAGAADAGDADDYARASRSSVARDGSEERAAGAGSAVRRDGSGALRNAWSEQERQSFEPPSRSSGGSVCSVSRGDGSVRSSRASGDGGAAARRGGDAAWRSDSQSDSECARALDAKSEKNLSLDSCHTPSARSSVDSIDERASVVLRQVPCPTPRRACLLPPPPPQRCWLSAAHLIPPGPS